MLLPARIEFGSRACGPRALETARVVASLCEWRYRPPSWGRRTSCSSTPSAGSATRACIMTARSRSRKIRAHSKPKSSRAGEPKICRPPVGFSSTRGRRPQNTRGFGCAERLFKWAASGTSTVVPRLNHRRYRRPRLHPPSRPVPRRYHRNARCYGCCTRAELAHTRLRRRSSARTFEARPPRQKRKPFGRMQGRAWVSSSPARHRPCEP